MCKCTLAPLPIVERPSWSKSKNRKHIPGFICRTSIESRPHTQKSHSTHQVSSDLATTSSRRCCHPRAQTVISVTCTKGAPIFLPHLQAQVRQLAPSGTAGTWSSSTASLVWRRRVYSGVHVPDRAILRKNILHAYLGGPRPLGWGWALLEHDLVLPGLPSFQHGTEGRCPALAWVQSFSRSAQRCSSCVCWLVAAWPQEPPVARLLCCCSPGTACDAYQQRCGCK